jgi:hypothetical protein
MKQCQKCNENKSLRDFHIKRNELDGLRKDCKSCRSIERKQRYFLNKDHEKAVCAIYTKNNKEQIAVKNKLWSIKNKSYIAFREKTRRHNDINYRLIGNLRKRLKSGSAIKDLGCSIEELKTYLELQFDSWMTWGNYGNYNLNIKTWQIDHIRPLSSFNLTSVVDHLEASNYKNLQPMLAKDNLSKGAKYE